MFRQRGMITWRAGTPECDFLAILGETSSNGRSSLCAEKFFPPVELSNILRTSLHHFPPEVFRGTPRKRWGTDGIQPRLSFVANPRPFRGDRVMQWYTPTEVLSRFES
jgi:hypothetical protein